MFPGRVFSYFALPGRLAAGQLYIYSLYIEHLYIKARRKKSQQKNIGSADRDGLPAAPDRRGVGYIKQFAGVR